MRTWLQLLAFALFFLYLGSKAGTSNHALQQGGNKPKAVEISFETVSVADFGAIGDGTDEWPRFQKAINSVAAKGGVVRVPAPQSSYRIAQALRIPSGVTVAVDSPTTVINCTGDAIYSDASVGLPNGGLAGRTGAYPFTGCVLLGTSDQTNVNTKLPTAALNSIAEGANTLTPSSPLNTGSFQVGDLINVETTTTWEPASGLGSYPSYAEFNQVTAIDRLTGALTLRYPVRSAIASAIARNYTTTGGVQAYASPGGSSGVPFYASSNAGVIGGTWNAAVGSFVEGGGMLDCKLKPHVVTAGYDLFVANQFVNCDVSVDTASIGRIAIEFGLFSSGTRANLGSVANFGPLSGITDSIIRLGEGATSNKVTVSSIALYARTNSTHHLVHLSRVSDNVVEIGSVTGTGVLYYTSFVESLAPARGASYPLTRGNCVNLSSSHPATQASYIYITDNDTESNVVTGAFGGSITNASGFGVVVAGMAGSANILRNVRTANGVAYCDPSVSASTSLQEVIMSNTAQNTGTCVPFYSVAAHRRADYQAARQKLAGCK